MFQQVSLGRRARDSDGHSDDCQGPGGLSFAVDVWHTFHYGVAKNFLGSGMIELITHFFHDNSWEKKFEHLAVEYVAFCQSKKLTPYITEMSRDTFSFDSEKSFPVGHWSKGAVSTNMMLFFADLLQRLVVGNTDDEVFVLIVLGFPS